MRYYSWVKVTRYLAPDKGGSTGTTNTGSGGAASQATPAATDPFAQIDLDNLDDVSREALEKVKSEFATLQKTANDATQEARLHQAERDRTTAELNRLRNSVTGAVNPDTQHAQPQTASDRVYAELIAGGIEPKAAQAQAKVLGNILDKERAQLQQQLGAQFAPVASLALHNHAEQAFYAAQAMDHVGWTQLPEVKELVWQSALELANNGQPANVETIKNLAYMHFCAFTEKNPQVFATLQNGTSQPNTGMNNPNQRPSTPGMSRATGMTYPGANFVGNVPQPPNPNAPRTVMDAPTTAALNAVTTVWKNMGLNPKG